MCVVPDMLDGMRVTELAEYCFSFKSMPEKLKTELVIDDILRPDMTELCDDYIERVILPDGMQKIGRLCFYNCSSCLCLSCHPTYVMWMVTLS